MKTVIKNIQLVAMVVGQNVRLENLYNIPPLADSIMGQGLLKPLVLRKDTLEVLQGHRRKRAIEFIKNTFPEDYERLFKDGVPCELVDCSNAEALILKVDHGNTQGLTHKFECQLAANMLLAAGATEEVVANTLSGMLDVFYPPEGKIVPILADLDKKLSECKDPIVQLDLTKTRRQEVLKHRRGTVQFFSAAFRCPDCVMTALHNKALGKGWGPTQSEVRNLHKVFLQDMSVVGPNGLPIYNKMKPGPGFENAWTALETKAAEKDSAADVPRPKARAASELIKTIQEGTFKSITVQRTIQWATKIECPDLPMLDESAMIAEQARQMFADEWKLLEAKVIKALAAVKPAVPAVKSDVK
jgi:hypothetical protein